MMPSGDAPQPRPERGSLIIFVDRLLRGGADLLAPVLRHLPAAMSRPSAEAPGRLAFELLRVLQPRARAGARAPFVRFALVLAITIGVLVLPTPHGLSPEGHRALALFAFAAGVLALEPVSLPIAALMVPVAQVALGVGAAPLAFEPFARPVVFLILASLFLAEALRHHGLTRRLALLTIVASGGGVHRLLLALMGLTAGLSMWVGDTATAAMLIPVALTIAKQIPDPKQARRLLVLLVLGIAYSASLGGMVTIMGAGANAVASGLLAKVQIWTFLDWTRYGLPSFLLLFPITWAVLVRMVPVSVRQLDVEPAREEAKKLGPMRRAERELLVTMGTAALLWIGGSFIESALGLPRTLLSAATVAVGAVAYLAMRRILDWEKVKGVSWGIFLIIGAGLSLGEALIRTGATEWFAQLIMPAVTGTPLLVSLLVLVYSAALLTNLINNTAIAAVFVPVLISLAKADPSLNVVQLVLPVTLATTLGYSLPSASGRMALIAATGIVTRGEMMRYGLVLTMLSSAVLALFFYFLSVVKWI